MAETAPRVLNAEIDVRSHFSTFDFPKLPEVIQAIEEVFHADVTKVLKSLRGPLMGLYRIQARDYEIYKGKKITLRGKELPVILRTQQEQKKIDGILITIYDSYSPNFQGIQWKDFDSAFLNMKEYRKDKITHKIYADSSLRHANQLALAANIACTSGGGIGQIVNAVLADPEKKDKVVIFAGANEIKKQPGQLRIHVNGEQGSR